MMLTADERVALTVMGPEGVREAIRDREALMDLMLGNLYPRILSAEIAELREILEDEA